MDHRKVTFHNRCGITLAADLYAPKGQAGQLPAIAVCGSFGAVKEQAAGLYAQTMAEREFLTVASTMYDMIRVNAKGYFDAEDSGEARYEKRRAMNAQRTLDYKSGKYALGGGLPGAVPEDAPSFMKDYHDYYKTSRGYHARSLNSNGGWNVTGCMSFLICPFCSTPARPAAPSW